VDAVAFRHAIFDRMEIGEITDGAASAPFSGVARGRLMIAKRRRANARSFRPRKLLKRDFPAIENGMTERRGDRPDQVCPRLLGNEECPHFM